MQSASSRQCLVPDIPNSKDGVKSHMACEEPRPGVSIGKDLAENMSNTLEQILDVLRGSTIAEERGKTDHSKFWATYKKVSIEYDDDFLERGNEDMNIILTFAGLFSAVNSTFITGMQPNPGDTTNALLLQLIQIIANGPNGVHDIGDLSSSTGYSSSSVWVHTLSYASLALSLFAAFGAVLGKQWLGTYKAARGRGSLEERSMQRQRKLDELEYWQLQTVLRGFLVLLQISLLLFGLSLSANMWTQQKTISSVIICTTAFGILFYGITILVSVSRPDSPFQTPGSELARFIWKKILIRSASTPNVSNPNIFTKSSAIRWILDISTNPDVVVAAAAMVPLVQWSPALDASAVYARLCDNFAACQDRPELFVKYSKAMAHLSSQSVKINPEFVKEGTRIWNSWWGHGHSIRNAFMNGSLAGHQLQNPGVSEDAQRTYEANSRTALRQMVVHGIRNALSLTNHENLIWHGDLRWRHIGEIMPSCEEFDWLIDYLERLEDKADDETEGDALLVLSAMCGLGSSTKQSSYVRALIRCMGPTRPARVRHAALRAISDARGELASITTDATLRGIDAKLLNKLSCALLTAVRPNDQTIPDSGPDAFFHYDRDLCYFRLIFVLANNDEWRQRLIRDGHLERCISLIDEVLAPHWDLSFYLAGIFTRIDLSGKDLPFSPSQKRWQTLMRRAWIEPRYFDVKDGDNCVEALPALVTATRKNLPGLDDGVLTKDLNDLTRYVGRVLALLRGRETLVGDQADGSVGNQANDLVGTAISAVQSLYDDLCCIIEHPNAREH